jgi:hypothetical protein
MRRGVILTLLILGALIASIILFQMGTNWYRIPIPILALFFVWLILKVRPLPRTGFAGKTLWDWLGVILIPVVLAIYAMNLSAQQTTAMQQQNRIADEQLKSQILQNYTSTIQDLILHE